MLFGYISWYNLEKEKETMISIFLHFLLFPELIISELAVMYSKHTKR